MKYVDEFRDPARARALIDSIKPLVQRTSERLGRKLQVMEFCGGHTHTIFRYGIPQMLPDGIDLVHGPGCPVCVLPMGRIDDCVALARDPRIIFTTFGDAMRVPGSRGSLLQAKADGADVRMVYSPLDALKLARENPDREVVFFALGFETTMPSTALTVLQARAEGIDNFSLFCQHITTVPTIRSILDADDMQLDGFLAPGHVSMVVGEEPFQFVARDYHKPIVITGFEPLDILHSLFMLLQQLDQGSARVDNQYKRVVAAGGNQPALDAVARVFETRGECEWRGLGAIEESGVHMRDEFAAFDAERKFSIEAIDVADPAACQCGDVLKGRIRPWQCALFGNACSPENPMGALMVSSEGACAAYHNFGNLAELLARRDASDPTTRPGSQRSEAGILPRESDNQPRSRPGMQPGKRTTTGAIDA